MNHEREQGTTSAAPSIPKLCQVAIFPHDIPLYNEYVTLCQVVN